MQNPDKVRTKQDALKDGINCVSLAHLAIGDLFDCKLPPELACAELYRDEDYFAPIEESSDLRLGDLVWFGKPSAVDPRAIELRYDTSGNLVNWQDSPVKHVAIYTGIKKQGDPLLLHATNYGKRNVIWPLSEFGKYERYKQLYDITRLKAERIGPLAVAQLASAISV